MCRQRFIASKNLVPGTVVAEVKVTLHTGTNGLRKFGLVRQVRPPASACSAWFILHTHYCAVVYGTVRYQYNGANGSPIFFFVLQLISSSISTVLASFNGRAAHVTREEHSKTVPGTKLENLPTLETKKNWTGVEVCGPRFLSINSTEGRSNPPYPSTTTVLLTSLKCIFLQDTRATPLHDLRTNPRANISPSRRPLRAETSSPANRPSSRSPAVYRFSALEYMP